MTLESKLNGVVIKATWVVAVAQHLGSKNLRDHGFESRQVLGSFFVIN